MTPAQNLSDKVVRSLLVCGMLCLLALLAACGDSSDSYQTNAFGGGNSRANFFITSVGTFNGFSETPFDSLKSGFLGPLLPLNANRFAVVTTDRRVALIRYQAIDWTYQFPDDRYPLPELASDSLGTVYAITTDGGIHSIDSSGKLKWSDEFASNDSSESFSIPLWPLVLPGGVLGGMTDGRVKRYGFDGNVSWEATFSPGLTRSVAQSDDLGIVLGVTYNGYDQGDTIVLLDESGNRKWSQGIEARIEYGPIIVEEMIIAGVATRTEEGKYRPFVLALDAEGKELWRAPLKALPTGMAADGNGNIYVCGGGGGRMSGGIISSFDNEGKERWETGLRESVPTSPLVAADRLHFLGTHERSIGLFSYTPDGGFVKFAPVESLAEIVLPPTVLPNGYLTISCSSQPILLQSRGGGFLGF